MAFSLVGQHGLRDILFLTLLGLVQLIVSSPMPPEQEITQSTKGPDQVQEGTKSYEG